MAVFVVDGFSSEPRVGREKTNHGDDINENTDGDGDSPDILLASHHFRLETCLPEIRAPDIVTDGGMDSTDNIILSKPNNKPKLPPKPTNISVKLMDFKRGAGNIDKMLIENYAIKTETGGRKLTGSSVINVSDNLKYDTLNNNLAVPTLSTSNIQSDSNNNSNLVIKINCDGSNIGTEEKDDSLRSTGSMSRIPVAKSGANVRSGHRTQVVVSGGNGQQPVFRLGPETGHCSVTPRLSSRTPDLSRSSTPGPRMTSLIPRPTLDHQDMTRSVTPGPRLTSLTPRPFTPLAASSRSRRGSSCGLDTAWGHRSLSGPGSLSRIPISVRLSSDNIEVGLEIVIV